MEGTRLGENLKRWIHGTGSILATSWRKEAPAYEPPPPAREAVPPPTPEAVLSREPEPPTAEKPSPPAEDAKPSHPAEVAKPS